MADLTQAEVFTNPAETTTGDPVGADAVTYRGQAYTATASTFSTGSNRMVGLKPSGLQLNQFVFIDSIRVRRTTAGQIVLWDLSSIGLNGTIPIRPLNRNNGTGPNWMASGTPNTITANIPLVQIQAEANVDVTLDFKYPILVPNGAMIGFSTGSLSTLQYTATYYLRVIT